MKKKAIVPKVTQGQSEHVALKGVLDLGSPHSTLQVTSMRDSSDAEFGPELQRLRECPRRAIEP
jgi:hypothetical protein